MRRIGIRELRNNASRAVRRAMAGERLVVTIDGVPAAQLGPLNTGEVAASIDDLIAAGLVRRPRATSPAPPPTTLRAPSGRSTDEVLSEHRAR
jgi:prevent-host-death family protein